MNIEKELLNWLKEFIQDSSYFLVSHKVVPGNNFKFFIDGDEGFPLSKSVEINRKMRLMIEEKGFFPDGNFSLEVSSPGIGEPLQLHRQYKKNIGRLVELELLNEEKKIEGRIIEVTEESIIIEKQGKKKSDKEKQEINFDLMKQAIIQIEFKK